jgi:ABC-2 type transport system permease protein
MTQAFLGDAQSIGNLWHYVGKLLRLRWVIFYSGFRRAKIRGKIGTIVLGFLVLGGLAFAFALSWILLKFLRSPRLEQIIGDTSPLLAGVPVVIVSAAFVGILLTSFGVLLQALYLAGDMDFLLSAPIPLRAVFITKMLQAILPNFSLILLFGLPVLYGLGASEGYSALYYPLVLLVLALLAMAAAGSASLLVMAVVRIFPARRVAEVLGFLIAILSFTCSQSGQLVNYTNVSSEQAARAFDLLTRLNSPWSPLAWAGRSLVDIGEGRWLSGAGLLLLTLVLTSGVFALSLATAERLYYSGWARVQVSVRKKKAVRSPLPGSSQIAVLPTAVNRLFPSALRAVVAKDFLMLRRDLRNMSQLVTPLILGIVYALTLIRSGGQPPPGRGEAPPAFMELMKNLMVYGNVGISLFVSWLLLARLATMGFSQEGKSYWLLKTAPVSTAILLSAKYLVAYLPTLALSWGFLVAISLVQRTGLVTLAFSLAVVALAIAGTAGLNLTFGVIGANFDWEDPRRISQGSAGCLGALTSIVFMAISLGLFFGPPVLIKLTSGSEAVGQLIGLVLGGTASLACALIPLWLVRKRVSRLGES